MVTKTVLVFKTSVTQPQEVKQLSPLLTRLVDRGGRWNFDLEDCDNILRVETWYLMTNAILKMVQSQGFDCEELP